MKTLFIKNIFKLCHIKDIKVLLVYFFYILLQFWVIFKGLLKIKFKSPCFIKILNWIEKTKKKACVFYMQHTKFGSDLLLNFSCQQLVKDFNRSSLIFKFLFGISDWARHASVNNGTKWLWEVLSIPHP